MQDTFITVEEAARRLSITPYTLREWLKAGKLRGVRVSRQWRVPERALTELATAPPARSDAQHQSLGTVGTMSLEERRKLISQARGSMKRPDYPNEVARFLEEKHDDVKQDEPEDAL